MEIVWGEKAAAWFINASVYTGFHAQLAEILKRHMESDCSLCDLGCGVGLIDFALSRHLRHITCVDISGEALAVLEREAKSRGLHNLSIVHSDAAMIQGSWDYGLMLFFHGQLFDHTHRYLSLFRRKLFYIVHADPLETEKDRHPGRSKCSSVSLIREAIDRHGIQYQLEEYALEYGQPFRSHEEAVDFVQSYRLCPEGTEPDFLKDRLRPARKDQAQYRWYLPHTKRFGMFIIEGGENAQL